MSLVRVSIILHVGAGATWLIASLAITLRRAGPRFLALQMVAALATLLAGIALWAQLHAAIMGPREHLLVVGTFCAFLALGLQLGIAGLLRTKRLVGGALAVSWIGLALLGLAAAAMIGSRFVA